MLAEQSTADSFLRDIIAHPSDPFFKLVHADWLDEQGQDKLAAAYRWCGANGRHPRNYGSGPDEEWTWFNGDKPRNSKGSSNPWFLPQWLYVRLEKITAAGRYGDLNYPSLPDAMQAIADHLHPLPSSQEQS